MQYICFVQLTSMDKFSFLNAAHTAHFAQLYDQYLIDPDSVEPSWRADLSSLGRNQNLSSCSQVQWGWLEKFLRGGFGRSWCCLSLPLIGVYSVMVL